MKLFILISTLYLSICSLSFAEKAQGFTDNLNSLYGKWISTKVTGFGDRQVSYEIEFKLDGSVRTTLTQTKERKGKVKTKSESMVGKYAVGASNIYVWSEGPPNGIKVEDPTKHYQSALYSYTFKDGKLHLKLVRGGPKDVSYTLKKSKPQIANLGK